MGERMFNDEQMDHMRSLSATDPKLLCWCGWWKLGECDKCPTTHTCADKMRAACPVCHNAPHRPDAKLVHIHTCTLAEKSA